MKIIHFWGQVAARTLGDLVRKLGEKILPEIIPILEDGLRSDKSDERQGVCIGLSEIMKSTSRDAVSYVCQGDIPIFPGIDVMVQVLHLRQKNTANAGLTLWTEVRACN